LLMYASAYFYTYIYVHVRFTHVLLGPNNEGVLAGRVRV